MVKRRPVVVVSPRLRTRGQLCTVVPISTTEPDRIAPYHFRLHLDPPLPEPYTARTCWVKADMVYTVSFDRLFLPRKRRPEGGKREYDVRVVDPADLMRIQACLLHGIGLTRLTDYL